MDLVERIAQAADSGDGAMEDGSGGGERNLSACWQMCPQRMLQLRCIMVVATALSCLLLALATPSMGGMCYRWNIKWAARWFQASPFLAICASVAGELYVRLAGKRPQPNFLHLAGAYFVFTACSCMFIALVVFWGCRNYHKVQVTFMLALLVCEAGAYGILQLMILVKCIALQGKREGLPLQTFLAACCFFLFWVVWFTYRIARYGPMGTKAGMMENMSGVLFLFALMAFTLVSANVMLKCAWNARGKGHARESSSVVMTHAASTVLANIASTLQMVFIVTAQRTQRASDAECFVIAHIADVVLNIVCALCVSGIATAFHSRSMAEDATNTEDILQHFREASAVRQNGDDTNGSLKRRSIARMD
eukprot:TRINITY_DN56925_c0_g1_i1.p1 TRINITY_DN56925_c0_g1~~TRINITY_DN56925_c0_g1_i1.p1  ORF type:complete len:365 (+),score=29.29 TRINITY_DN56925_c0_g1_i1:77-1171(+)